MNSTYFEIINKVFSQLQSVEENLKLGNTTMVIIQAWILVTINVLRCSMENVCLTRNTEQLWCLIYFVKVTVQSALFSKPVSAGKTYIHIWACLTGRVSNRHAKHKTAVDRASVYSFSLWEGLVGMWLE